MGKLFGDKHIAAEWYGISEEEKLRIQEEAQQLTDTGTLNGWSSDAEKSPANTEMEKSDSIAGPQYSEKAPVAEMGAIDWSPYNGQKPAAETGGAAQPPHTLATEIISTTQAPHHDQSQVAGTGATAPSPTDGQHPPVGMGGIGGAPGSETHPAVDADRKDGV